MAEPTVTVKIYDLQSNELADITPIALEKKVSVRENLPRTWAIGCPSNHSLLTSIAGDGYRNLRRGNRKVIISEDGVPVAHSRIFGVERTGDGRNNRLVISGMDPLVELGTESGDRAGRLVRDVTGNFIDPSFDAPITGGDLIYQVLVNSQQTGAESDPTPGEGPLPIDLTDGTFDTDTGVGIDLSPEGWMGWPMMIGDFIAQIVESGVVDIWMRPVDPTEGLDPYAMVSLSAVNSPRGADLSATVHFDYATGSKNASYARHVEDFTTINNKLYDYTGPPREGTGGHRWKGNITPGSPGTTVDPSDSRDLYGVFMQARFNDTIGPFSASRPMDTAQWNAEQGYRIEPRDLLYLTPAPGAKALFRPFGVDYESGDIVAVNLGGAFGLEIAAEQRIMGYDVVWDRNGVQRVSQLITTADV